MPAEWEKHDAVWLAWPHDPTTFPDRVERVEEVYAQIVEAVHEGEDVNLFVKDSAMKVRAVGLLEEKRIKFEKIHFFIFDYADVWFRDYGPIFAVKRGRKKLAMLHWLFNAWGGKYEKLVRDAQIPDVINQGMQLECFEPGIVLEGGSIDINDRGALLTTEQCVLNRNRNPHLGKSEI